MKAFVSHPTLEPSLVPGNEEAVAVALTTMGITLDEISSESIDEAFQKTHRGRKGEFALELSAEFAARRVAGADVHVPEPIRELFEHLFADFDGDAGPAPAGGHAAGDDPGADATAGPAPASEDADGADPD